MTTPPEGERAKLAGEVTEGDRALWESLCRLNACAANVEDYQEESVALIAKFRASVAVSEAVAERDALEAQMAKDDVALGEVIDERDDAEETLSQAFYLITGRSPEWSNLFGHAEALEEVDDAQTILRESLKQAESKVAALEALVVRLRDCMSDARNDLMQVPNAYKGFNRLLVEGLALVPSDLADCVCVNRQDNAAQEMLITEAVKGADIVNAELKELREGTAALEAENNRLDVALEGILTRLNLMPDITSRDEMWRIWTDTCNICKAALQPAPKV